MKLLQVFWNELYFLFSNLQIDLIGNGVDNIIKSSTYSPSALCACSSLLKSFSLLVIYTLNINGLNYFIYWFILLKFFGEKK